MISDDDNVSEPVSPISRHPRAKLFPNGRGWVDRTNFIGLRRAEMISSS